MELDRFATMTGGQAYFPVAGRNLAETFDRIQKEIAARYSLGYVSSDPRTDGAWRSVEIKLRRADLKGVQSAHPFRLLRALQGHSLTRRAPIVSLPYHVVHDRLLT